MNVHVSYKVPQHAEVERQMGQLVGKLQRRLRVYQPDLVHLHAMIEAGSARAGFSASLNLRLPSGQMAAHESGPSPEVALKASFADLLEQLSKHKEQLRSQYKWQRRSPADVGRAGKSAAAAVPFEETLAAVQPATVNQQDITSWINANLSRLQRLVERELRARVNAGELSAEATSALEIVDDVVVEALGDQENRPEKLGLEAWLFRLARRALDAAAHRDNSNGQAVPLEESFRRPNVLASDEPQLQYHQPDESMTGETVIADRRIATPEQIAATEEMIDMVELALLGAKRDERDAFILFAIEGFTVEEICAISDQPAERVKASIARARERLRRTITMPNEFKDKLLQHSKSA